jgi:hypothetical protein
VNAGAVPDFGTADLRAFPNPPALPAFVSGCCSSLEHLRPLIFGHRSIPSWHQVIGH